MRAGGLGADRRLRGGGSGSGGRQANMEQRRGPATRQDPAAGPGVPRLPRRLPRGATGLWASAGLLALADSGRCLPPPSPCLPFLLASHMQENKLGQKFVVDATLVTDLSHAGHSDDVHMTVNYAEVYE